MSTLKHFPSVDEAFCSALHIEIESDNEEILEQVLTRHLELFCEAGGKEADTWAGNDRHELEKYRLFRHAVPELINMEVDRIRLHLNAFHKYAADFSVPFKNIPEWETRYHRDIAQAGLRGFVFGHILDGRLHVNLLAEDKDAMSRAQALLLAWSDSVAAAGGILASENGTGKIKAPLIRRFAAPSRIEQLRIILDCLNPYRAAGGLLDDA